MHGPSEIYREAFEKFGAHRKGAYRKFRLTDARATSSWFSTAIKKTSSTTKVCSTIIARVQVISGPRSQRTLNATASVSLGQVGVSGIGHQRSRSHFYSPCGKNHFALPSRRENFSLRLVGVRSLSPRHATKNISWPSELHPQFRGVEHARASRNRKNIL